MSSTSNDIGIGYATLRLILDPRGLHSVPVGVVGWNALDRWHGIRLLRPEEKVSRLPAEKRLFIELVAKQLDRWVSESKVPYSREDSSPWETSFWESARRFLTTAIRLDRARAMDPSVATESQLEGLFDAIVQPRVPKQVSRKRIDGAITRALGDGLAQRMQKGMSVRAFSDAKEVVSRGAAGDAGTLIIEGVNLAARSARRDADAAVSKILRIREGQQDEQPTVIVGYNASPGGLNGEADMVDWIRKKATTQVYDLEKEREAFRKATISALDEIQPLA